MPVDRQSVVASAVADCVGAPLRTVAVDGRSSGHPISRMATWWFASLCWYSSSLIAFSMFQLIR
jgi:hypothetical protein